MRKVFFLLSASLLISGCSQIPRNLSASPTPVTQISQPTAVSFTQSIRFPDGVSTDEQLEAKQDESALDVLRRTHHVTIKTYSFGDIADGIDGYLGGTEGRYWIFYVNGKMSEVGAGEYKVKNGDSIIWKFQKESEGL